MEIGAAWWSFRGRDDELRTDLQSAERLVEGSGTRAGVAGGKGLSRGLAAGAKDGAAAVEGETGKSTTRLEGMFRSSTGKIGGFFKSQIGGVVGGLGAMFAASKVIEVIAGTINAASQLQQSAGAIESVFGSATGKIAKFAEGAAESIGLSKRAVQEMAAVMGAQLKGMGFSADEAADRTIQLQKRAADMAATFGGTTADAIAAISSLMRGERDPIEKYGVSIKAADVNARILALGLDTSTAAALKNAEAMAGMELLMESTASAAGQFGRESDSLAGNQQQLNAKLENAAAHLGEMLLPAMAAVAGFTADVLVPALVTAIDVLGALLTPIGWVVDALGGLASALGIGTGNVKTFADDGSGAMRGFAKDADGSMAQVNNAVAVNMGGVRSTMERAVPPVEAAAQAIAEAPRKAMEAEYQAIRDAAYQSQVEHAKGLMDGQNLPQVAFDAAMQMVEDEMTQAQEVAHLKGQLTMLEHAAGLAAQEGKDASVVAINEAIKVVTDRLGELNVEAFGYGRNFTKEYAAGIVNELGVVKDAGRQLGGALSSQVKIESEPPDPTSPLAGITRWGGNIPRTIAYGIRAESSLVSDAMRDVLAMGIHPMAPARFAGAGMAEAAASLNPMSPTAVPVGMIAAPSVAGASGEKHIHAHLEVLGRPDIVDTEADLSRLFGQVIDLGFPPSGSADR